MAAWKCKKMDHVVVICLYSGFVSGGTAAYLIVESQSVWWNRAIQIVPFTFYSQWFSIKTGVSTPLLLFSVLGCQEWHIRDKVSTLLLFAFIHAKFNWGSGMDNWALVCNNFCTFTMAVHDVPPESDLDRFDYLKHYVSNCFPNYVHEFRLWSVLFLNIEQTSGLTEDVDEYCWFLQAILFCSLIFFGFIFAVTVVQQLYSNNNVRLHWYVCVREWMWGGGGDGQSSPD